MKEKKEYSRSVRMTETVKSFVEAQNGEGFNEKFENMVLYAMKSIPDIEKQLDEKQKRLQQINKEIAKKQSLQTELETMQRNLEYVFRKAEALAETY